MPPSVCHVYVAWQLQDQCSGAVVYLQGGGAIDQFCRQRRSGCNGERGGGEASFGKEQTDLNDMMSMTHTHTQHFKIILTVRFCDNVSTADCEDYSLDWFYANVIMFPP